MSYGARFAMPPSRLCCRCLVFLLLVVDAGFLAPPAEDATRPFADIVDADLVHAVIAVESGYRATAQSPAGAQGLMQLMPGTQRDLVVSDAFDPRQNVDAGVAYLRRLTDEFGTVLALAAAYNAGPGAVRRYNGIPPYEETHAYVRAVLGRGRPEADVQEPEEQDPSADRTHAGSEADHAEGAPVALRQEDDHPAADGASGLEALDEAAEPDPAADTVRFMFYRDTDRLMVDSQASDPSTQRESERRPHSVDGHRDPANAHRSVRHRSPPPAARIHHSPNRRPALPPACREASLTKKLREGGSRADEQTRGWTCSMTAGRPTSTG